MTSFDINKRSGVVRTDMYCHQCDAAFVASLDFDVDGDHVVECPKCGHEHCRVIKAGVVTSDRWSSKPDRVVREPRGMWTHQSLAMRTSVASMFIRDRWLNRSDGDAD